MAAQIQGLDTEYKPWGGLAGIMTGVREADTEAANLLALQESQLGNVVKARDAAFAQDEMGNQELRNSRMQGMIGDSQVKTAAGRTAMGTQKSDMQAKIAENLAKVPKAQVEQALATTHLQTQGLMGLAASLEQSGGGLEFATRAMEMAPKLGMQPQDLQQLLSNPQLLAKKIQQNQQMLTMVPAVLQKMVEQKQAGEIQEGIHAGDRRSREVVSAADNASRQLIEDKGIAAGKYDRSRGGGGGSFAIQLGKLKVPERLGVVERALATGIDPETNEPMSDVARIGYEAMKEKDIRVRDADNAARSAGKIDTPAVAGLPTATPPSVGGGAKPVSGGHWEVQGGKKVWVKG